MGDGIARPIDVYVKEGIVHVRVDRPGVAAVSAPVPDVVALIVELAKQADFEVDDTVQGELYVTWPV